MDRPKKTEDIFVKFDSNEKKSPSKYPTVFDYLRFGESYTSLLLGIVVIVIAGLLFVSFLQNKANVPGPELAQEISSTNTVAITTTPAVSQSAISPKPTVTPTPTLRPTNTPTVTPVPTRQPTVTPTQKMVAIPTPTKVVPTPTKVVTPTPTTVVAQNPMNTPSTYTTKPGDDLWNIAVRVYGDGYKWTEIAKANKIENPNLIYANTKLTLPKLDTKSVAQTTPTPEKVVVLQQEQIKGNTYTVVAGDDLWDIALRAYGDGYQWVEIANANKLTDPNLIFSGNKLTIPRK